MDRTAESQCLLCRQGHADKKGSHMIPAFLISTAISFEGSKKRDQELMSMMRKSGFQESFVGRSVLPEAIETVKSTKLLEAEIEENINPNVRDYFFCSKCETKFGNIENLFAKMVFENIEKGSFETQEGKNDYRIVQLNSELSLLTRLFFFTVIWRISVASYLSLKLSKKCEDKVRDAIDSCLDLDVDEMMRKISLASSKITEFPVMVLFTKIGKDLTKGTVYADEHKLPHFIILNQFTVFFYEKKKQINSPPNHFFGLTDLIKKEELLVTDSPLIQIGLLNENQTESFRQEVLKLMIDEMRKEIRITFGRVHEKLLGYRPPDDVIYTLTHRIVNNNAVNLYDKFTSKTINTVMVDFFMEMQAYMIKEKKYPRFQIGDVVPTEYKYPK